MIKQDTISYHRLYKIVKFLKLQMFILQGIQI